ncbi:MAG: YidB family protein [Rhodospirillales bacterium]|nr:YidB family protein [Rhodospirillales bacterium]
MELVDVLAAELAGGRLAGQAWRTQAMQEAIGSSRVSGGGLERVLHRLEEAGLGDVVRSWQGPGRGPQRRLSPQQLHAVLGNAEVARLAGRAGLTGDELTAELSQCLPAIVANLARSRETARRPA